MSKASVLTDHNAPQTAAPSTSQGFPECSDQKTANPYNTETLRTFLKVAMIREQKAQS